MEFIIRRIAEYYYNRRLRRRDIREIPLIDWKKAEKTYNNSLVIFVFFFYIFLLWIHSHHKNTIVGFPLPIIWLTFFSWFLFRVARKDRNFWPAKLILAFVLTFFLIIPIEKYEKIIVRPFEKISRVGPVEFYRDISNKFPEDITTLPKSLSINYINNGGFEIPLFSKDSNWGTGKYSDWIRASNPDDSVYFMRFGGVSANADISNDESISGANSLHIRHESGKQNNVVGVLEQKVYLATGRYELSLKAKLGYAVSQGAVWVRFDSEKWLGASGFDIPDRFPIVSSWLERKKIFSIDNCGNFRDENGAVVFCLKKEDGQNNQQVFSATFSIVTTDQCEVWIDNIRLTRIGN